MMARRHGLLLAAALLAGIATGAAWPPPALPKIQQGEAAWSLPAAHDLLRHVPQDLTTVTSNMRWRGEAGSATNENATWRLAGIVNKDGPAILIAMLSSKSSEIKRIAIGEALPDGSQLEAVDGDLVTTKRDSCRTTYQLYLSEAVDQSADCKAPDASTQGLTR